MDLPANLFLAITALAVEALLGYPQGLYRAIGHPVTWIGRLLDGIEARLNRAQRPFALRRACGFIALGLLLSITAAAALLVVRVAAYLPGPSGLVVTALLASSLLAQKSLYGHVHDVAETLAKSGIPAARAAVGKIVGRDVEKLDARGISRAAIESLAENFSDAVVAPALFLAFFGLPGLVVYKALNTADSMIGHRSERFLAFGFAAAKLDDLANFLPARLSALLVVFAALLERDSSARGAATAALHHSHGHPSPNAPWPEAAFAGALGLRLGGPRCYEAARVEDAWIGSDRDPEPADILRALALYRTAAMVHATSLAGLAVAVIVRG
jgi:adenosylcobinamide-phosphate synthase